MKMTFPSKNDSKLRNDIKLKMISEWRNKRTKKENWKLFQSRKTVTEKEKVKQKRKMQLHQGGKNDRIRKKTTS